MGQILGVEIFRTGTWNGDTYSVTDLDEIVRASQEAGFVPPLKQGHTKNPGAPALGWVANLRRVGGKLLADFVNIPGDVLEQIRERRFGPVSTEIFWNLERGGRIFRRALGAVALLGAQLPAVAGLKPAFEMLSLSSATFTAQRVYTFDISEETDMTTKVRLFWGMAAQREVADRMKAYCEMHPEKTGSISAYRAVLDADPGLKLAYAGLIRTEQEAKIFAVLRGFAEVVGRNVVIELARSL